MKRLRVSLILCLLVNLLSTLLFSQEHTIKETNSYTTFGLKYGTNLTTSAGLNSQAIGGEWGMEVNHIFSRRLGAFAGINYLLVHVGDENDYTSPRDARRAKMLETPFGVNIKPFNKYGGLNLRLALSYGQILNTDRIHVGDASFNRLILNIGGEYEWRTPASLSLRTGIKYRTFKLGDEAVGRLSTVSLYCTVGLRG